MSGTRLVSAFALGLAAACVFAQPRPAQIGTPPPAAPRPDARPSPRPVRPSYPFGRYTGGWMPWGWTVDTEPERRPMPSPVKPEKEMPVVLKNEGYVRERPEPVVRDYSDGELRPSPATPTPNLRPTCTIRYHSGETVQARDCWTRDDVVGYTTSAGRRVRITMDLADWN